MTGWSDTPLCLAPPACWCVCQSTSAFVEGLDTSLTFLKDAVSRMQNPESAADPKAALEVAKVRR